MKTYLAIVLAGLMAGCAPEAQVAGANYISLDGTPVAQGTPLEETEKTPTVQNLDELPAADNENLTQ